MSTTNTSINMEEILPMEIKMVIFEYLSISELNNIRLVCREWNDTLCSSKANLIWSDLIKSTTHGKLLFIPNDDGNIVQLTNQQLRKIVKLLYLKQQASLSEYNSKKVAASKSLDNTIIEDPPSSDDDSDIEYNSSSDEEITEQTVVDNQQPTIEKLTDFNLIPQREYLTEELNEIQNNSKEKTILSRGLKASTVDNTSQDIDCTRDVRNRRKFWSSTGSKTTQANEYLIYQLQDPWFIVERERKISKIKPSTYGHLDIIHQNVHLSREENPVNDDDADLGCISQFSNIGIMYLERMTICPFVASWQSNNCYSPKFVSLSIGLSANAEDQDKKLIKITEDIPVEHNGNYQQFALGPLIVVYERRLTPPHPEDDDIHQQLVKSKAPIINTDDDHNNRMDDDDFETDEDEDEEEEGEGQGGRIAISMEDAMIALDASGGAFNERFMEIIQKLVNDRLKNQQMEQEEKRMLSQLSCREHGDLILRADLIGKVTTQPLDNLYYTCLEYFDISGSAFTV